jgi:cytochrome c2
MRTDKDGRTVRAPLLRACAGHIALGTALLGALVTSACKDPSKQAPPSATGTASVASATPASTSAPSAVAEKVSAAGGDAAHGKALMLKYECNRCHDGTGHEAAATSKHCVKCHTDIVDGKFNAPAASLTKWKPVVAPLAEVPSLHATGKRFTRDYIVSFLLEPKDMRPKLVPSMPRFDMSVADARDIAAYLVPEDLPVGKAEGDTSKGRTLLDSKGCGTCHAFTGVSALSGSAIPVSIDQKTMVRAQLLAPDLRHTRDRFTVARLVAWLRDPKKVKPDTTMPVIPLTDAEANDIAAYLMNVELAPTEAGLPFKRLPPLERKVTFSEVDAKVFHKTCWHCHAEPDFSIGDGGPGNSGGLGFRPRGLNLASYEGVMAGLLDKQDGKRASVFKPGPDGVPLLIKALIARHAETKNGAAGDVRGMPLGMPPLSAEEIQLVDTWVAQGRPK